MTRASALSPARATWHLRGLGGEALFVSPFDAPAPPEHERLTPLFVNAYLEQWLMDPESRRVLLEMHTTLLGAPALALWSHDEIDLAIRPALRTAFDRGDLVVWTRRRDSRASPGHRPISIHPKGPSSRPPRTETTFIEIVLIDREGTPIRGERFRITAPGGDVFEGRTDRNGFARVDGLDHGQCTVEFPDRDGREWSPGPPRGPLA